MRKRGDDLFSMPCDINKFFVFKSSTIPDSTLRRVFLLIFLSHLRGLFETVRVLIIPHHAVATWFEEGFLCFLSSLDDHRKSFPSALIASGIFRKSFEAVYDKRSAETSSENLFSRTRTCLSKAVINRSRFLFIACCRSDLEDETNSNKFARSSSRTRRLLSIVELSEEIGGNTVAGQRAASTKIDFHSIFTWFCRLQFLLASTKRVFRLFS